MTDLAFVGTRSREGDCNASGNGKEAELLAMRLPAVGTDILMQPHSALSLSPPGVYAGYGVNGPGTANMKPQLLDWLNRAGRFAFFTCQCLLQLPMVVLRPAAVWQQLYGVLLGTLPLAIVAGAALGVVSWLQIRGLLFSFNSETLLPSALALAVVRGVGPVIAGLIGPSSGRCAFRNKSMPCASWACRRCPASSRRGCWRA
jgi:hypothetical protein